MVLSFFPKKNAIGSAKRMGIANMCKPYLRPPLVIKKLIIGDIMILPKPTLAFTIPEMVNIILEGIFWAMVPIITPKERIPDPVGKIIPRQRKRESMDVANGVKINPTAIIKTPETIAYLLPFFAAIIPTKG